MGPSTYKFSIEMLDGTELTYTVTAYGASEAWLRAADFSIGRAKAIRLVERVEA